MPRTGGTEEKVPLLFCDAGAFPVTRPAAAQLLKSGIEQGLGDLVEATAALRDSAFAEAAFFRGFPCFGSCLAGAAWVR